MGTPKTSFPGDGTISSLILPAKNSLRRSRRSWSSTVSDQGPKLLFTNAPDNASDELLLRVQKIQAMKRPSSRAQLTLFNLIRNTESLVADEADFVRYSPDLAALVPGDEHGWFITFLEDIFSFFSQRLTKVTRLFLTTC